MQHDEENAKPEAHEVHEAPSVTMPTEDAPIFTGDPSLEDRIREMHPSPEAEVDNMGQVCSLSIVKASGGGFLVIMDGKISGHTMLAEALGFITVATKTQFQVEEFPRAATPTYQRFMVPENPNWGEWAAQPIIAVKRIADRAPTAFMSGFAIAIGIGAFILGVKIA